MILTETEFASHQDPQPLQGIKQRVTTGLGKTCGDKSTSTHYFNDPLKLSVPVSMTMEGRSHNSWEALLVPKTPVRVLVIVRKLNRLFECSDASIKEIALQHLHEEDAKTLVIAKWPSVTTMVFDLFNNGYDFQNAHNADVMDVIAIDLGPKQKPKIAKMSDVEKMEVNASVAEFHRLNGFEVQPPFVEDHRDGKVPAYPNPRL